MRICLVLLLAAGFAAADARTAHYDVHAERMDEGEAGALLEALHARLSKYFGRAPEEPLRVEVYATRKRWAEALAEDGIKAPEAGGYYSPKTKKATLFVQPSDYFTRQLLLHEATHQFHYLVATGNQDPKATWYTEGLAEYFGMHDWDGKTLQTEVVPAITLEDYPARAMEHLEAMKWDLEGIAHGRVKCDRPEAWALVHFLVHTHLKEWRALSAALDAAGDPRKSWEDSMGGVTPELVSAFREWVEHHTQPWKIVWIAWQQRGEAIEGRSDVNAIAIAKEAPATLDAELEIDGDRALAGLVFGFHSPEDFLLLQVLPHGRGRVVRRKEGRWGVLKEMEVPAPQGRNHLFLSREGAKVSLSINGASLGTWEADGEVGLNVDSGRALFYVKK